MTLALPAKVCCCSIYNPRMQPPGKKTVLVLSVAMKWNDTIGTVDTKKEILFSRIAFPHCGRSRFRQVYPVLRSGLIDCFAAFHYTGTLLNLSLVSSWTTNELCHEQLFCNYSWHWDTFYGAITGLFFKTNGKVLFRSMPGNNRKKRNKKEAMTMVMIDICKEMLHSIFFHSIIKNNRQKFM